MELGLGGKLRGEQPGNISPVSTQDEEIEKRTSSDQEDIQEFHLVPCTLLPLFLAVFVVRSIESVLERSSPHHHGRSLPRYFVPKRVHSAQHHIRR
jgi:hypothetical protein